MISLEYLESIRQRRVRVWDGCEIKYTITAISSLMDLCFELKGAEKGKKGGET